MSAVPVGATGSWEFIVELPYAGLDVLHTLFVETKIQHGVVQLDEYHALVPAAGETILGVVNGSS